MKVCKVKALFLRLVIMKFLSDSVGCATDEVLPFDQVGKPLHDAEEYLTGTFGKDGEASTSSYNLGSGPLHTNPSLTPSSSSLSSEVRYGPGYFSSNPANLPYPEKPVYYFPEVMSWKLVAVPVPTGGLKSTYPETVNFPYAKTHVYQVPRVVTWKPIVGEVGPPMFVKSSVLSSNTPPFVPTGGLKSASPNGKPPATPQAYRSERKMGTLAELNGSPKDQWPNHASQSSQATEEKDHNSSEKLKAGVKMNDKQDSSIETNSHDSVSTQSSDPKSLEEKFEILPQHVYQRNSELRIKSKKFVDQEKLEGAISDLKMNGQSQDISQDTNPVVITSEDKKPNSTYLDVAKSQVEAKKLQKKEDNNVQMTSAEKLLGYARSKNEHAKNQSKTSPTLSSHQSSEAKALPNDFIKVNIRSRPTSSGKKEPKKINRPQKTAPPYAEGGKNIENKFLALISLLDDDSDGLKSRNTEERELENSHNNIDIIKYDGHSRQSIGKIEKSNNEASDGLIPSNGKKRFNSGLIGTGSSSGDPEKEVDSAEKQKNHDPVNQNNEVEHADQSRSRRLKAETQISSQVITRTSESVSPNEAQREKKSHQTETNLPIESVTETSSSNNQPARRNAVDSKLDFEKASKSDSKDKASISDDLKDRFDPSKADQNQVINTKRVPKGVETRTVISSGNRKGKTKKKIRKFPPSNWKTQRVNHRDDLLESKPQALIEGLGAKTKEPPPNSTERRKAPNQSPVSLKKISAQEVPGIGQLEPKSVTERNLSEEIAQIINNGLKKGFEQEAKYRKTVIIHKLSQAFNSVDPDDPDKFSFAARDGKEFSTQIGLKISRNGKFQTVDYTKLRSNVAELLRKHLKAENIQACGLLPDMDHTLFKKLQLAWYIDEDKFIDITSSLEIGKGKHNRMLALAKQIAQHTSVENYETLESHYIKENHQNSLSKLRRLKEDFMLTTQFPFVTNYSERRFTPPPEDLALLASNRGMYHILNLVLRPEEAEDRLQVRREIDTFWGYLPALWKSKVLEDYYKHTDLDLRSTMQATLLLHSLSDGYLLEAEGAPAIIHMMEMIFLSQGKKFREIPWHESSTRRYLIETLGEEYHEMFHKACTLIEPYQASNEENLEHSKAAKVSELATILKKKSIDLIRFADIGFDLNCIQVLMLLKLNGKMKDETKELVWDSFEKILSIKLSETQKSYIELWFDANVQL